MMTITPFICIDFYILQAFHVPIFDSHNNHANNGIFPKDKFKDKKVSYAIRCASLCYT